MRRVLADTGPVVAIFSPEDQHHKTCVEALRELPGPLLSCWTVIAEAAWLLRHTEGRTEELLESVSAGFLELAPISSLEARFIAKLMTQYADLRPQLADATLVYLAEREGIDTIFTLDRRDFSVYRVGRRSLRIIPEVS